MRLYITHIMFILNTLIQSNHSFLNSDFIVDYFNQKKIYVVNVIVHNQLDATSIHRGFQRSHSLFLSLVHSADLEQNNYSLNKIFRAKDLQISGVFVDLNYNTSQTHLEEVISKITYNCCYNVVLWNETGINSRLKNIAIPFGTELTLAVPEGNKINLHSIEILKNRTQIIKKIGSWNNGMLSYNYEHNKKNNLNNQILQGIISITDQNIRNNSALMVRNDSIFDQELSSLAHFALNIYGCLQTMYNFKWELTINYDALRTKYINNMDFLITSENKISEINIDIAKLPSIKKIRQCFIFRHPPIYSYITFYLEPFSFGLWISLGIFILVSSALLYIMCLFQFEDIDNNELSAFGNILFCLGALLNQGLTVSSERHSKRIIHFNILQLSLFISNFYSAIILNYLLYPTHIVIHNIDDIIKEGFDLGIENTVYNNISFLVNTSFTYRHNIQNLTGYYDVSTGVEKLRISKFAFLSIDSNIYTKTSEYFTDIEICDISAVPLREVNELTMYLIKPFPYKELFQKGVLLLKETGIVNREDKIWNKRNIECLGMGKYVEMGLKEISFAYKMFIFGLLSSLLIFVLELICSRMLHLRF